MQRGNGRLFAYLLAAGQIFVAILSMNERTGTVSSTIASQEQLAVIQVLSFSIFGITQVSSIFFIAMLCILMVGGLGLNDYSNFLSSFVKIQLFLEVMFWILYSKYAPDIRPFENLPIVLLIVIQLSVLILLSKLIELAKHRIEAYRKEHSNLENINKAPLAFSCPHCGYLYRSIPIYCVNCKKEINSPQN
jgi:hypothetical protein